jgi:hypothetical protein
MRLNTTFEGEPEERGYLTRKITVDPFKVTSVETNECGKNIIRLDNGDGFIVNSKVPVTEILQKIEDGRNAIVRRL